MPRRCGSKMWCDGKRRKRRFHENHRPPFGVAEDAGQTGFVEMFGHQLEYEDGLDGQRRFTGRTRDQLRDGSWIEQQTGASRQG